RLAGRAAADAAHAGQPPRRPRPTAAPPETREDPAAGGPERLPQLRRRDRRLRPWLLRRLPAPTAQPAPRGPDAERPGGARPAARDGRRPLARRRRTQEASSDRG